MIAFHPTSRHTCGGFAPYLVTPHPDAEGFVFRMPDALVIHAAGAEIVVPDSADANLVAVSPGGMIAWVTRKTRIVRRWQRAYAAVARDDAQMAPGALAVIDDGVVVAGGHVWTRAHEEHAHAEAVYEMGVPYDYGEKRPSIPPRPPFEPGVLARWSSDLARVDREAFSKAVVRVAVDPVGRAFAGWAEDGVLEACGMTKWRADWTTEAAAVPAAALVSGGEIAYWTHHTGVYRRDPIRGVQRVVAFEPSEVGVSSVSLASRLVAFSKRDGSVRFFSLDTGGLIGEAALDATVHALAFARDGRTLAAVHDTDVVFGEVVSEARVVSLP